MLGQIFGALGGLFGKELLGGGIFSTIGRFAGKALGNYLEKKHYDVEEFHKFKNVRDSFVFSAANYGEVIPLIFGKYRLTGKIIWASQVRKVAIEQTEKSYFINSGATKAIYHNTEFEYYVSFAVSICEGEISEISRVWADRELINIGNYKFRLYKGSNSQEVDNLIASTGADGRAPAFRDLAYIVFEDINLGDFDNKIPTFSFEVTRRCSVELPTICTEDTVKSIVMIPGSGEYVYDTVVQYKTVNSYNNTPISRQKINSHNYHNIANSLHSLNQLKITCTNVEWVAPVVCWFGDSLDAGHCNVKPAVEFNDENISYSEEWRVAGYNRDTARLISRDAKNNPQYGGSVNDASVVRYLQELKSRNLKIMFYPMVLLDLEQKPWRGRLSGAPSDIRSFFNKRAGYNNFILHYANLVKDYADAFIIGSEFIGLTKVAEASGVFPAVDELVNLARRVKQIVGPRVCVTYAADWSEYHHTIGGWYNLDPLWASPDIDFIGIDAYFPVTHTLSSYISPEDLAKGWQKGQGYDYYIDENNQQQSLQPAYAWKNIKYWWENTHTNPNGQQTAWTPRSKKIWFTEFGFPSIDKASNQPNVFFDPLCLDGGEPVHSSGEVDFAIQRKSIRAFIEYWQEESYIGEIFLWTWDARPYPAWPHMNFWRDNYLWEKGHWVNNKFGSASLAAIILELSARCNIDIKKLDVSNLDEIIEGFVIDKDQPVIDSINLLRIGYLFDIKTSSSDSIVFVKRGTNLPQSFSADNLIKLSANSYLEEVEIDQATIISKLNIYFIDHNKDYGNSYIYVNSEYFSNTAAASVMLPIVLSHPEAERIGQLILNNAANENKIIKFIIPITNLQYEPADLITFSHLNRSYMVRIVSILLRGLRLEVKAIIDDYKSYHIPHKITKIEASKVEEQHEAEFYVLDLPLDLSLLKLPNIITYLKDNKPHDLYAKLDDNNKYNKISTLQPGAIIGKLVNFKTSNEASIFLIDRVSKFTIYCENFPANLSNNWNLALVGNEIIRFKHCQQSGKNLYEISYFIRAVAATEEFINTHSNGEIFVLLTICPNIITISEKLENLKAVFKVGSNEIVQDLHFQNKSQKLPKPYIKNYKINDGKLVINIASRHNSDDWTLGNINKKFQFIVSVNNSYNFITNMNQIVIDLTSLSLSGQFKVNIIAQDERQKSSLPLILNINQST